MLVSEYPFRLVFKFWNRRLNDEKILQVFLLLSWLRLLLSPVRVGTDALSWAAKKIEPNKVGLPTSPSTTAVKDRVLQAAAKHESQPSDADESSVQTAEA